MNETIKEKRIRYLLITFFVLLTATAIFFRTNKVTTKQGDDNGILAVVLKESAHAEENPVIAMYNKTSDGHILTMYEIERDNQYHFHAKSAATLKTAPSKLALDESGIGLWVKINEKWNYFNDDLQVVDNPSNNYIKSKGQSIPFSIEKDDSNLNIVVDSGIHKNKTINLTDTKEPQEIYSLTSDGTLWLIVFEDEINIAISTAT